MSNRLCIYHGNCADGFTSAWVVKKFYGDDIEFHPGVYSEAPPDVTGRTVIFVDFVYKLPVMEEILAKAKSVVVIDHHKINVEPIKHLKFTDLFYDTNRSGAGLTWDYFFPGEPRPYLVDSVEDRDLWNFKIPNTELLAATIFSYEYTFANWDMLVDSAESVTGRAILVVQGESITRKHHKDIAELCKFSARPMQIGGYLVHVANLPYTLSSDACHVLRETYDEPFGACYIDAPQGRVFSLRSVKGGPIDVGEIAAYYGGGGHPAASGFTVPWGHSLTQC